MSQVTLTVFAEKVQQMQLAKNNYLKKLKVAPHEKSKALEELQKVENEVDSLLYAILHQPSKQGSITYRSYR